MLKRTLTSAAVAAALAFAAAPASAEFMDFQIQEGSVPGAEDNLVTGDKFSGAYVERLTINDDLTVDFTGFVTFLGLTANEGQTGTEAQINGFGAAGYSLYAIFQGSGNYNPIGGSFSITSSSLDLYIDPNKDINVLGNQVFGATGADGVTVGNNGDDYKIAYATNLTVGSGIPGVPGAFQAIWDDFKLTEDGEDYFVAPRPFYLTVEATGDFDVNTFQPGTFDLTGDVSAVFIPEPGTLALTGLALGVVGFATRRRRAA